jgi:transcriptional regulator with XRE-family HTH domain
MCFYNRKADFIMQTIGERIKQLRNEHKTTQEELAKIAGLKDRSSIANWEADRVTPDYDQLQKVAEYFNVTIDYLINGKKEPPSPSPRYTNVPLEPDMVELMCQIPLLSKTNRAIIRDMVRSMIKNQE